METLTDIKNKLATYDYVSFDIWDTLIFRTVSIPREQQLMVPLIANNTYHLNIDNYYQLRIEAEGIARSSCKGDVTLEMIYSYLPYPKDIKHKVMEIEIGIEVDNCVCNPPMVELAKWCVEKHKKVVIITDMYLPRQAINRILKKIGVHYDYLFISSEEGKTKRDGDLYSVALDRLGVLPTQILHIGDNVINDIERPKEKGILSIERLLPTDVSNTTICGYIPNKPQTLQLNHFRSFLRKSSLGDIITPEFRLGYAVLGPLLYNFCWWLHKKKEELLIEKLLFVAREGFLIKQCYDAIFPLEKSSTEYIRLNKNLLRLPSITRQTFVDDFITSIPVQQVISWKEVILHIGIEDTIVLFEKFRKSFPSISIEDNILVKDLKEGKYNEQMNLLYTCILEEIHRQRKMLIEYIEKHGILTHRCGMVNNSYHGSGQYLLQKILEYNGLNTNLYGLQFIKSSTCEERLGHKCFAWLSEEYNDEYDINEFWLRSLIFEHWNFEPSGTALKFARDEQGGVITLCETPRKEKINFDSIHKLQSAALEFINRYQSHVGIQFDQIALDCYFNFLSHPLKEDAKFCGELWDDDVPQDRQINNMDCEISFYNAWSRNFPPSVRWPAGFLVEYYSSFLFEIYYRRSLFVHRKKDFKVYLTSRYPSFSKYLIQFKRLIK